MRTVDAHDVRDWMTRLRVASYARGGVAVSSSDVERQVVADCELADAARRAGDIKGATQRKPAEAPRARRDALGQAQQETGTHLTHGEGDYERSRLMHCDPTKVSEKWAHAAARIQRITQTANTSTSDLVKAVESAELSKLATEYLDATSYFWMRHRPFGPPDRPRNPFFGLSRRDALRKYERVVYDICDRSTGKLGHWYIK